MKRVLLFVVIGIVALSSSSWSQGCFGPPTWTGTRGPATSIGVFGNYPIAHLWQAKFVIEGTCEPISAFHDYPGLHNDPTAPAYGILSVDYVEGDVSGEDICGFYYPASPTFGLIVYFEFGGESIPFTCSNLTLGHEIGHYLGLGHSPCTGVLMFELDNGGGPYVTPEECQYLDQHWRTDLEVYLGGL